MIREKSGKMRHPKGEVAGEGRKGRSQGNVAGGGRKERSHEQNYDYDMRINNVHFPPH